MFYYLKAVIQCCRSPKVDIKKKYDDYIINCYHNYISDDCGVWLADSRDITNSSSPPNTINAFMFNLSNNYNYIIIPSKLHNNSLFNLRHL